VRVSVSVLEWVRVRVSGFELEWDWTTPRVLNSGAEGMMVLVEFPWLRSISGADAPPPSPSSPCSSVLGRPAITVSGALVARPLSSFLAALENDRALFLKKLEAPAIIPLPALLPPFSLPLDESVLVLDVAWIWGAGGREVVFDLGVERGVRNLESDFGEGLGLSGEDILSVGLEFEFEFESVDGKPEFGFEGGEGDGDDDEFDGRRLERGLNFDIVGCVIIMLYDAKPSYGV